MSKVRVKIVANVEINEPKSSVEKQSTTERNDYVRQVAEETVFDALKLASLNPQIIRVRLTKGEK